MSLAGAVTSSVASLPAPLLGAILLLLPADQRAQAACVCRAWRAVLADPALWLRLDFSVGRWGVSLGRNNVALRAACARARGGLEALDVTGRFHVRKATLRDTVVANSASLRELRTLHLTDVVRCIHEFSLEDAAAMLVAAPALRVVEAALECNRSATNARRLLRKETPFQPLQLQELRLAWNQDDDVRQLFPVVMAEIRAHTSLKSLVLECSAVEGGIGDRFVELTFDVALALGLTSFDLRSCAPSPATVPALVRLLSSTSLTELTIHNEFRAVLLDATAAALLGNALRANCTLRELRLLNVGLWNDAVGAASLFGALTGHAHLHALRIFFNRADTEAEAELAGGLLGALVAADAPALGILDVSCCNLGDVGFRPLVAALPQNTHLHDLRMVEANLSVGLIEEQLLPALRANTSLRFLDGGGNNEEGDEEEDDGVPEDFDEVHDRLRDAEELVAARAAEVAAAGGD